MSRSPRYEWVIFTRTVLATEALPVQPVTATRLVTVPGSGMASVVLTLFVAQAGDGGTAVVTVDSSLFGEPAPGFVTRPVRAAASNAACTCGGVYAGCAARTSAAAPATCGEAIEVPLMVAVAVSLARPAETIPTPGAKMSTQPP